MSKVTRPGAGRAPKKAGAATTLYLNTAVWQDYKTKCIQFLHKSGSSRIQEMIDADMLAMTKPPMAALYYWKQVQALLLGKLDKKLVDAVNAVIDKEVAENPNATTVPATVNIENLEAQFKKQTKIAHETKAMMKKEGVLEEASKLALSLGLSPDKDRSNAGEVVQKLLMMHGEGNTVAVELLIQHLQALAARNELKNKIREARLEERKEKERLAKVATQATQ